MARKNHPASKRMTLNEFLARQQTRFFKEREALRLDRIKTFEARMEREASAETKRAKLLKLKSKRRVKISLRQRLLRRWGNGSLRVKELSRMGFGKIPISKEKAIAAMKALDAMAQAAIANSPLTTSPLGASLLAHQQANMYPLGHSCSCPTCQRSRGLTTGLGGLLGGIF